MRIEKLDKWQQDLIHEKRNKAVVAGRQVGKSTAISVDCGEDAVKNKNYSILIISATERQAEELFIKTLLYLQEVYPTFIKKGKDKPTKSIIKLTNGSIIRCLPTGLNGIGIRGFTVNHLIADEAHYIPEEVWAAVTPMLLTTGGRMTLLGTPKGRSGFFYQCFSDPTFITFHVNSIDVISQRKLSDVWTEKQRELALQHIEREKSRMSSLKFAQEYLGEFVDDLRQFFSDSLLRKCMTEKRKEILQGHSYFLGVDVARMGGDETTFEIIDRISKEKLIHVENITRKETLLTDTIREILELDKKYNFKKIYIDDGGLGVGVFDYLHEFQQTKRKVIAINNAKRSIDSERGKTLLKEDLYTNLLRLMEREEIKLLDDDNLLESMRSVQIEINEETRRTRIDGEYTHIVEGLIRASWCVRDMGHELWCR